MTSVLNIWLNWHISKNINKKSTLLAFHFCEDRCYGKARIVDCTCVSINVATEDTFRHAVHFFKCYQSCDFSHSHNSDNKSVLTFSTQHQSELNAVKFMWKGGSTMRLNMQWKQTANLNCPIKTLFNRSAVMYRHGSREEEDQNTMERVKLLVTSYRDWPEQT